MNKRFILIDLTLEGRRGHSYSYAAHTLAAARSMGFAPVLLCPGCFAERPENVEVHPVYRHTLSNALSPPHWYADLFRMRARSAAFTSPRAGASTRSGGSTLGKTLLRFVMKRWWRFCVSSFARRTSQALQQLQVGPGDLIFLPTVSSLDLAGVRKCLAFDGNARSCAWHLLFHLDLPSGNSYLSLAEAAESERLRTEVTQLKPLLAQTQIWLYTDTQALAEQYNELGIADFRVLPIPHAAVLPGPRRDDRRPINIVYAGDARREKGYHLLPGLIRDLWPDCIDSGDVTFSLQSNFNNAAGEAGIAEAKRRLQAFPQDRIRVLDGPLSLQQYEDLLRSADINLLLYDRRRYRARSSGILLESLCLGIPVITSAGTWLSQQILAPAHQYLKELCRSPLLVDSICLEDPCRFNVQGRLRQYSFLIPAGAGYAVIDFRTTDGGGPIVADLGAGSAGALLEQCGSSRTAFGLLRLPTGARNAVLRLRAPLPNPFPAVESLRVHFLQATPSELPSASVGIAVFRIPDAAKAVREMLHHFRHYRETAQDRSESFRQAHSGRELLRRLMLNG